MERSEKIMYLADHTNLGYNIEKKIKNDLSQFDQYTDEQIDYFYREVERSRNQGYTTTLFY